MSDPKHPKLNPHPKQAYEITLTIDGAPGPFESITGGPAYEIVNAADCVKQDPISGAHPTSDYAPTFTFSRVGGNTFKGIIYLDLLRNESYYLKEDCHWRLSGFGATATVHGANFFNTISLDEILSKIEVSGYQQKRLYLDRSAADMNVPAESMSPTISGERDKYFTMSLVAKEISHE